MGAVSTVSAVRFRCGSCNYKIKVSSAHAGKKGKCPSCQVVIRVPEADGDRSYRRIAASPRKDRARRVAKKVARAVSARQRVKPSRETKECRECGEEILAVAKKCRHCGEFFDAELKRKRRSGGGAPTWVNTAFAISGYLIFAFGLLGLLNAGATVLLNGGRGILPGLLTAAMAFVVLRVGWGLKDRNKVAWIVAMVIGTGSILLHLVMIGLLVSVGRGALVGAALMTFSLVLSLIAYVPPAILGLRHYREIEWA